MCNIILVGLDVLTNNRRTVITKQHRSPIKFFQSKTDSNPQNQSAPLFISDMKVIVAKKSFLRGLALLSTLIFQTQIEKVKTLEKNTCILATVLCKSNY